MVAPLAMVAPYNSEVAIMPTTIAVVMFYSLKLAFI